MKNILLLITLLLSLIFSSLSFGQDFVLNNVLLPDFKTRQLNAVNLEIADGKIKQIVDASVSLSHLNSRDGNGQVIMPALIDMHSHSMGNSSLDRSDYQYIGIRGTANAMLYAGVHGWLDLYSDEKDIFGYRDQQDQNQRNEAFVFAAGPCFTVPTGHCDFGGENRLISTPEQAVVELQDLSKSQPNVVKIVFDNAGKKPTVDKATLAAFINQAKQLKIKSVVHAGSWDDIRTATELGADAVTHLPWTAMPADIPKLMADHGTAFIPTAGVIGEVLQLHQPSEEARAASVLSIPMTQTLVTEALLSDYPVSERHPSIFSWLERLKAQNAHANRSAAVQQLNAAGVQIFIGSDAGNFAVFQGVGFHREMYFLQQLGMSPWDILAGASHKAYEFLGLDWGLKAGRPAHFTLHDREIFKDVSHSTQVKDIYLAGQKVEREPLLKYAKPGFIQYAKLFLGFEV